MSFVCAGTTATPIEARHRRRGDAGGLIVAGGIWCINLVSQDLSDFQHIHSRQLSDGGFVIKTSLKRPGLYKVYTDVYPLDGAPQFLQTNISAAGWRGDLVVCSSRLCAARLSRLHKTLFHQPSPNFIRLLNFT